MYQQVKVKFNNVGQVQRFVNVIDKIDTDSMTHEKCRQATKKAIVVAEDSGAILSFDPNLREALWNDLEEAREQILYGILMILLSVGKQGSRVYMGSRRVEAQAYIQKNTIETTQVMPDRGEIEMLVKGGE